MTDLAFVGGLSLSKPETARNSSPLKCQERQKIRPTKPERNLVPNAQVTPQIISIEDCNLGVRRRLIEMRIMLVAGGLFLFISVVVIMSSGLYSEPGLMKIASSAISFPSLYPFKVSWDRFTEARFLRDIKTMLQSNLPLSKFSQDELSKILNKRNIIR